MNRLPWVLAAALVAAALLTVWPRVALAPPGVAVVESAPGFVPGYERGCSPGQGCVFGPAWSDDVGVRLGHNGCDTRNDLLNEALTNRTHRAGTRGCVVLSGDFLDPYTGQRVHFDKATAHQVHVDHVFALTVAWQRGAAEWPLDRRRDFANDPDNLVVTTAGANQSKGDRTPASWLPAAQAGKCLLASRFIDVAGAYQLTITRAELMAVQRVRAGCGG